MIYKEVIKIDSKPNWCPLKEVPSEKYNNICNGEYLDGYDDGWNDFRSQILNNR